jgi:phenylpropionate dioxygenase-like ring-hydroxylating dioxygenase large terminal subunit
MISIDPKFYCDQAIFDKEIDRVFSERLFIGTISDFAELDSYRAIQIGNNSITIRKTSTGIRAFSNVCLHRNALIDPLGIGKKPFRCPYHAWTYDANGKLSHAPKAEVERLRKKQLRVWNVQIENGLVFIGGTDLHTSEVSSALQTLSIEYSEPFYHSFLDHNCNWKLLVENVLEGYHISMVHPQTFVPSGITSNSEYHWSSGKYTCWGTLIAGTASTRTTRLASIVPNTRLQYGHTYIFPNVFVSNGNDHIGYIGHFIPTGPNSTRLEWCLFEQALLLKQSEGVRQSLRQAAITFTETTLKEDRAIVESCQIGLRSPDAGYQLLDSKDTEARVLNFLSNYKRRMPDA